VINQLPDLYISYRREKQRLVIKMIVEENMGVMIAGKKVRK
jgi:hypothetical protein